MNLLISLAEYYRKKKRLKSKPVWTKPSHWNKYKFLCSDKNHLLVCFKDPDERCGNFFYAYPNVNLCLTFFASKGCLTVKVREITKLEWVIRFCCQEWYTL